MDTKYIVLSLICDEILEPKKTKEYPLNRILYIRSKLAKYGKLWVITAIIDGSIGYHTYTSAENLLNSVLKYESWVSERTAAIFNCDASLEIASDIYRFERIMKENPEKAKKIMEFINKIKDLNHISATSVSMLYPTIIF